MASLILVVGFFVFIVVVFLFLRSASSIRASDYRRIRDFLVMRYSLVCNEMTHEGEVRMQIERVIEKERQRLNDQQAQDEQEGKRVKSHMQTSSRVWRR